MAELKKLSTDPNFVVELAVGPPIPDLVAQKPGSGIEWKKKYADEPQRFIMKKAHLSSDDFRCWNAKGQLIYNAFHPGKNPYATIDPLQATNYDEKAKQQWMGEWEFHCDVKGHNGFQSFQIRPKNISRHGTQIAREWSNNDTGSEPILCMGNMSRTKTQSVRHWQFAGAGDNTEEWVYKTTTDLAARTVQVFNRDEELVAFIQKSAKTLMLNAAFGAGSETLLDVAAGVDASVLVVMAFTGNQVGASIAKDALNNFVADPLKDAAQDQVVEATGTEALVGQVGKFTTQLINKQHRVQKFKGFFK